MHNGAALAQAVLACRAHTVPFTGLMYRTLHLHWFHSFATAQPLFSAAGGSGSRYVPPGGPAALYAAFDFDTAYRETNQIFFQTLATPAGQALADAGGLRPDPVVLMGIHANVSRLLDLRNPNVRQHLNIVHDGELLIPWKNAAVATATQELGQVVHDDDYFEGVIYPSAQNAGHDCLVLFRIRLLPASRIHFLGFHNHPVTLPDAAIP